MDPGPDGRPWGGQGVAAQQLPTGSSGAVGDGRRSSPGLAAAASAPPAIFVAQPVAVHRTWKASAFLSYVCIGFGATVALLGVVTLLWLAQRRARRRRELVLEAAAQAEHDARRQQQEDVQQMIAEKRLRQAALRTPYLVVNPDCGAVVAFKVGKQQPPSGGNEGGEGGEGEGGLIGTAAAVAHGGAPAAVPLSPSYATQELMSRRALVATAALSGRTTSGLSHLGDAAADVAPQWEAAEEEEATAAATAMELGGQQLWPQSGEEERQRQIWSGPPPLQQQQGQQAWELQEGGAVQARMWQAGGSRLQHSSSGPAPPQ